MLLDRKEDVEIILNLTDFDPSGYYMPQDLQNRCERIGLDIKVLHIGILPNQIPEDRKTASLITYKKTDPRCKKLEKNSTMIRWLSAIMDTKYRLLILQKLGS